MANRNWASGGKIYSMHVSPVFLDVTILVGASGAVTSFKGAGILSVAKQVADGTYKITMQANTNFPKLYYAAGSAQSPASGLSGVCNVEIQNDPNGSVNDFTSTSGGTLIVKCIDYAGALVNPASGASVNVLMVLSNSSVVMPGE